MSHCTWVRALALASALAGLAAAAPGAASAQGTKGAPKGRADEATVKASFDAFAVEWMGKMQRVEEDNRRRPQVSVGRATYRGYGRDFRVELKPTGYAPAPYVGVLRYEERTYRCSDASAMRCDVVSRLPVTELFRYQNGRWIY